MDTHPEEDTHPDRNAHPEGDKHPNIVHIERWYTHTEVQLSVFDVLPLD